MSEPANPVETFIARRENSDQRYDQGMLRARSQAENYARALPADEGRPPFVVVVDVGRSIELYSEFSRSGATYTPFPDPRTHRIRLDDLRDADLRARLRGVWLDPLGLDPARRSAAVTREIAGHLAELARALEQAGHAPQAAAGFLTRCLFTMFAEDVELIPKGAFRDLLGSLRETPAQFMPMLGELWRAMDAGLFSAAIRADLLRFNGKLFKHPDVLALDRVQIDLLIRAADADWREVEPAIFGTLLERALDADERHALGAHYTPRAYVERLVLPTVIEPLREDWKTAQAAALTLATEDHLDAALREIVAFHQRLRAVRVLDPACGSGNFLYVTLEHLKRLEGEVLNAFDELDPARQAGKLRQGGLALDVSRADPFGGETVDPHQLLGIELNPRAAAIAELVLWIGYLQWHFRTRGAVMPPEPVLKDFRNIECRDAVLAWDRVDYATDASGKTVTRWNGKTYKASAVTGEPVPDETARVPLEVYANPRKAAWPDADFVVGNPPFIGNKRMRLALGDGYVEALRGAWPEIPQSADFVMYWWGHAAELTAHGALRRFGLITTNSIRQTFNRRVVEASLRPPPPTPAPRYVPPRANTVSLNFSEPQKRYRGFAGPIKFGSAESMPLSLSFAIPDHPWVDAADGAAVRIAMTVASAGSARGALLEVIGERADANGEVAVDLRERRGVIHADLRVGADVAAAVPLHANAFLSNRGVIPHGEGMVITEQQAIALGLHRVPGLDARLRPYRNGRDLSQIPRHVRVIDMYGLTANEVREQFPEVYQWLLERVKPERDQSNDRDLREKWWLHRRNNEDMRRALAGLSRYIATIQTAKHRFFVFLDAATLPDDKLIAIGSDDAALLGVLSSCTHVAWALAAGARLGVGNDPVYNKSTCFDCFPFPIATSEQQARIRDLAEQLDAHRKRQQAVYPDLTLTGMYNVLDKLRSGAALTAKERTIHEHGLVSVLRQLHDELDLAVLDAYGWNDLAPLLQVANGNRVASMTGAASAAMPSVMDDGQSIAAEAAPAGDFGSALTRDDTARAFDEAILDRLVALNVARAAEEKRGLVRWLRPAFQNPHGSAAPDQAEIDTRSEAPVAAATKKQPWPKELADQVRAVADALAEAGEPLDESALATRFTARGRWRERLPTILDTLVAIGRARRENGRYSAA